MNNVRCLLFGLNYPKDWRSYTCRVGRHTWGSLDYAKHKCNSVGDSCKLSVSHIQKGRLKSKIEKLTLFKERIGGKVHLKVGSPLPIEQESREYSSCVLLSFNA